MPNIKHVLFPTDFSEQCRGVSPFVVALTRHFEARLTLLHSIGIPPESYVTYGVDVSSALKTQFLDASAASMQEFAKQGFGQMAVQTAIEEGSPAQVIVDYAKKQGVDLIMMPTHGYGPLRRFLIGSVTAKVLHDAQCPVWTSVHTDTPAPVSSGYQTILCAVDSGPSSVPLMRWATWLAGRYGAALKLVHVIPAVNETSMNRGEREVRRYLFAQAREEFPKWIQEAGVTADVRLRGGEIAARVAETALQEKADLLVVGRGHVQRTLGGLRTHSLELIREAPCPVISV
jgi:nucleotide-binding universal stress UspA family protein